MPRSKALNTYPRQYWTIVERCAAGGEVFEMKLASITKALSLQGQFYAFRGALRREYERTLVRPNTDPEEQAKLRATLEFAEVTVCWVDRTGINEEAKGPVTVRYMSRDRTPMASLLDEFLKTGKTEAVVTDETAASEQELLEKLALQPPMKGYMKP